MDSSMERNEAASRPTPVLMIPLRRCGSHAIRLRLNINKKFYSPYPLHIIDFMPLVPLYGNLDNDDNYFRLVVDVIGLQATSMVKWDNVTFDPIEIFDVLAKKPRSVHQIVWELLLRAGDQHRASVVMDKSLDSVHYAHELLSLFPSMRFLNVVRDPRAQVASMNRAIIHDFDTLLNALTWRDAHISARFLLDSYPGQVLTIRYEDFLSNQESTLQAICEFLQIEFLPAMLDLTSSKEAQKISKQSALWESNLYPPILANVEKFKKQLTMDEIQIIETITREFMQYYGYSFMTSHNAEITKGLHQVAKENSEARRLQAWRSLQKANSKDFVLRSFRRNYLSMVKQSFADPGSFRAMAGHMDAAPLMHDAGTTWTPVPKQAS